MRGAWHRFARERQAVVGLTAVALILAGVIFGPLLVPHSPIAIDHAVLGYPQPPSWSHWLGTDLLGRDVLVRALVGGRVSISVGITAMLIAIFFGTFYGAISGMAGGGSLGTAGPGAALGSFGWANASCTGPRASTSTPWGTSGWAAGAGPPGG